MPRDVIDLNGATENHGAAVMDVDGLERHANYQKKRLLRNFVTEFFNRMLRYVMGRRTNRRYVKY